MNIFTETRRLTPEEFFEANRIALEFVKLHKTGIITGADDERAVMISGVLKIFGASFAGFDERPPTHPGPYEVPKSKPAVMPPKQTKAESVQSVLTWQ